MPNIAVLTKLSLDVDALRAEGERLVLETAPLKISDGDLNAIEAAVRLKEGAGGKVYLLSAVTWGPVDRRRREVGEALRRGLAMGADEAYSVVDEDLEGAGIDVVSRVLAKLIEGLESVDLVLSGEGSIDGFSMVVPGRVAALLGWPYIPYALGVRIEGDSVIADLSFEEEVLTVRAKLPAVISVTREINTPRIPTLRSILMARRKTIKTLSLGDLGLEGLKSRVVVEGLSAPRLERKGVFIRGETVEEMVEKLIDALRGEGVL